MRTYIYKLKDDTGKTLHGFTDAYDRKDLKKRLRHSNYFFVAAEPAQREKIFNQKVDLESLLVFTRRLSSLIDAGIPILGAMHILWRQTEDKQMQLVISHLRNRLEEGKTLSAALEDFPRIFPGIYRAMIEVAEKAGGLTTILRRLTEHLEYQRVFVARVRRATWYPIFVICFALAVFVGMFTFFVPTYQKVLVRLKVELPFFTQMVLSISEFLRSPWTILGIIILVIGGTIGYRSLSRSARFRYGMDRQKLKLPVFGDILRALTLGRFVRSLSILVASGLPIIDSFRVAKTTASNEFVADQIDAVQKKVERGNSLYDSFREVPLFPVMFVEMVGVGESSGTISQAFAHLADHFDEEVDYKQSRFFTYLEPALILIVGAIVLVTLLAIYMPIFSVWQGLMH